MNQVDVFDWTSTWAAESGLKFWSSETATSTNLIAKDDTSGTRPHLADPAALLAGPSLYLTRKQTAGRGRGSNTWSAAEGTSLLASWSFAVAQAPQPVFSALAGLALYEACSETWPLVAFNLKAPNDLYIERAKVAGILIETVETVGTGGVSRTTVIGTGMNISQKPTEIENATCLCDHLRSPLTATAWRAFLSAFSQKLKAAVVAGLKQTIPPETAERLLQALNQHPLLSTPYLKVDEQAQLHSAHGIKRWQDL